MPIGTIAAAARVAFALGLVAVTVLSLLPGPTLPTMDLSDKIEHMLAYAFLAATACFGFGMSRPSLQLAIVVGLAAFGGMIELVQPILADRSASVADGVANVIGIALGWLVARTAGSLLQRPGSA